MEDFDKYLFEVEYEDWMEDISGMIQRVWASSADEAVKLVETASFIKAVSVHMIAGE